MDDVGHNNSDLKKKKKKIKATHLVLDGLQVQILILYFFILTDRGLDW